MKPIIEEKNQKNLAQVFSDTFVSYKNRGDKPLDVWVKDELKEKLNYSEEEAKKDSNEILSYTKEYYKNKVELQESVKKGNSIESWVVKKIDESAKLQGISNVAEYAGEIETALQNANKTLLDTVVTKGGDINKNPQLHGFIAEQHHVNSFNIDATVKGSEYRAEMCQSTAKNSVDILIKDKSGNIVRKYSSKFGKTAEDTQKYFEHGDYRGQRKLVPEGQEVPNSSDVIESPDGVKSSSLSYEESQKLKSQIQQKKEIPKYSWDRVGKMEVAKETSKQIGNQILISAVFHGAVIVGKRLWDKVKNGKIKIEFPERKNPFGFPIPQDPIPQNPMPRVKIDITWKEIKEDLKEWFERTKESAKDIINIPTVAATATTIAVRKGLISAVAKNTPAGRIAGMVIRGIENAKIMYKIATGKITMREGFNQMAIGTAATIGSIVMMEYGAGIGAAIGTVFGPVGTLVGGAIGGMIGSMAGSKIGEMVVEGAKKVAKVAGDVVKTAYDVVKDTATAVATGITNVVRSVSDAVSSMVKSVSDTVSSAVSSVKSFFGF